MRTKPVAYDDSSPQFGAPGTPAGLGRRAGAWFLHELREILPPTIFFFIGFNLIVLTTNLILADYFEAFGNFMLATGAALVVGKAVLVTNAMPLLRRYDRGPLIQPILFKTAIYWAVVFVFRLLEGDEWRKLLASIPTTQFFMFCSARTMAFSGCALAGFSNSAARSPTRPTRHPAKSIRHPTRISPQRSKLLSRTASKQTIGSPADG
jgi:hypothetical protein